MFLNIFETLPGNIKKAVVKNMTNTCKCNVLWKIISCTGASKVISTAIAVALSDEGVGVIDVMGEAARNSLGAATIEAVHSAIVEAVKQLSDDNVSGKTAEEIADIALEVGVCGAEFINCVTTKVCSIMFCCDGACED